MRTLKSFRTGREMVRRSLWSVGWAVMLCASGGCPQPNQPSTMASAAPSGTAPSADLSLTFHLEPSGTQLISPGQRLTYRVIVDSKGILNAGVEFEATNLRPEMTASLNGARIAETARETQLIVQAATDARPGDYDFRLQGRLTVSGQGAPTWTPIPVPLRVPSNESGFSLACTAELALPAGQAKTLTCRTIREPGFNASIDLSFASHPGYIMIYPETATVGTDVGGFAFTVVRSLDATTPAFYDLVAIGRSSGLTRQSTTRLQFQNP